MSNFNQAFAESPTEKHVALAVINNRFAENLRPSAQGCTAAFTASWSTTTLYNLPRNAIVLMLAIVAREFCCLELLCWLWDRLFFSAG